MWVPVKHLPMATRDKYKLHDLIKDGKFLDEVHKGIYGYHQADHTPCLFVHDTLNIKFVLTVDDFGVKYHIPLGSRRGSSHPLSGRAVHHTR
jgi:hypothetical protein